MGIPAEHTALLKCTGFPIPVTVALDAQERELLGRCGFWLEGLAKGNVKPCTPEQRRFVRVACGEAEPVSAFEVAWVKYCQSAEPLVDPLELAALLDRLRAARAVAAAARDEYNARRDVILSQVRPKLDALEAEFADHLAAVSDELAGLEGEARQAVLAYGASFRHAGVHAVYSRGRVTWDSKGLNRYEQSHPEIGRFRRIGSPSVSLRFEPQPSSPPPPRPTTALRSAPSDELEEWPDTWDEFGDEDDLRGRDYLDDSKRDMLLELGLDPDDPDYSELAPHGMSGDQDDDEEVEEYGSLIEDYMDSDLLEDDMDSDGLEYDTDDDDWE